MIDKGNVQYQRCHSARKDLLLTLLICINKPILDRTVSALGVGAEPHRQKPGLCLSVCPLLCSCSNASGDSISLAFVGFPAAAATRSPMVRDQPHCFLSVGETRGFSADCCRFEGICVPMRSNQIKRSRRVGLEGWKSAWQEARSKRARLALWPLQTFDKAAPLHHARHRSHHINSDQATPNTATARESRFLSHLNLVLFLQLSPTACLWL